MGDIRLDRWLHLITTPAFLAPVRANEHGWRPWVAVALMAPLSLVFGMAGYLIAGLINSGLTDVLVRGRAPTWPADLIDVSQASLRPCGGCLMGGVSTTVMVAVISLACLLAVLISAVMVYRRPARTWITAAPRFRWRLFVAGLMLFGLPLAAAASIPEALHGWPDRPVFLRADEMVRVQIGYVVVMLLALPLAAAFEEVLCRGWLLQVTAAFTHSLPAILLFNSLIFALMHVDADPGRNLSRAVLGMALSWGVLRSGGVELGLGVHSANNLVILLLAKTVQQADASGSSSPTALLINLLVSLGAVAVVELVAHWAPLRAWSGFDVALRGPAQEPVAAQRRTKTLAAP